MHVYLNISVERLEELHFEKSLMLTKDLKIPVQETFLIIIMLKTVMLLLFIYFLEPKPPPPRLFDE